MATIGYLRGISAKSTVDLAEMVIAAARDLAPDLRARSRETDALARIPDDIIERMTTAGLFKLTVPRIYGGLQMGPATYRKVIAELGRGDLSVGWTASLMNNGNWLLASAFPKDIADEIFATPGGVKPCGSIAPGQIKMRQTSDGYLIEEGVWRFASGVYHANWGILGIPRTDNAGNIIDHMLAFVPSRKIATLNDWDTIGMRGTGSSSISVRDLFVPKSHVTSFSEFVQGRYQSTHLDGVPLYRIPPMPMLTVGLVLPMLGAAKAALEIFLERLPRRGIKYTFNERQGEASVTHLQLGEITAKIEAAELFVQHCTEELESAGRAGDGQMDLLERARLRRNASYASRLIWEAVDLLASAAGASIAATPDPLNRIWRDLRIAGLNAGVTPTTSIETYGRMLCGLEPNSAFI